MINKMGLTEDEVHEHKGDNFSACNHYDNYHSNDLKILHLAIFHALLSSRSRDMGDDKALIN
jgi:hypothetical protein